MSAPRILRGPSKADATPKGRHGEAQKSLIFRDLGELGRGPRGKEATIAAAPARQKPGAAISRTTTPLTEITNQSRLRHCRRGREDPHAAKIAQKVFRAYPG